MINILARLGEIVKGGFLEDAVNKPKEGTIIKVNFNPQKMELEFDVEDADMEGARKYLLVNLGRTGRQNQFSSTFTDEERLLGENEKKYKCWISLEDELQDGELKNLVSRVINVFYDKNTWVLKDEYAKKYEEFKKEKNIKKPSFITVLIDGKPVSEFPEYKGVLEKSLLKAEKTIEINGTCGVCGKSDNEFFEASPKDFKFFITDKLGFSPNLSDRWEGSLVVCSDCRKNILKGESLVNKYFTGKVEKINYMLLPYFLKLPDIDQDQIDDWINRFKVRFDAFYEQREEVKETAEYIFEDNLVVLNWVFYEKNNQQLNVFGIIKDVVPSDVDRVKDELGRFKENLIGVIKDGGILKSLGQIYHLIPIRDYDVDIPKIVAIFNAILKNEYFDWKLLIHDFLNGARAIHYESGAYKNLRGILEFYILKTNQLLVLLGKKGGIDMKLMEKLKKLEDEGIVKYVETAKFNEMETALFLIGIVVGIIGRNQYKDYGHKPILDKINFSGMSLDRVKILVSELQGKIHQLKLYFAEKYFSVGIEILSKNLEDWSLSPFDNVYYILSGYSYENAKAFEGAKDGEKLEP